MNTKTYAPTNYDLYRSGINKSPSRITHSFSKADRFTSTASAKAAYGKYRYYEKPDTFSLRAAGIGIGDRTKVKVSSSPDPTAYTLKSDFRVDGKAFTFGLARELCIKVFGDQKESKQVPGPGTYKVTKEPGQDALKYTLRPKTACHSSQETMRRSATPGPGQYEADSSIDAVGNYFNSKYPSSGVRRFSPPRSKRFFETSRKKTPEPGTYNPKTDLSATGEYFLSNIPSSRCRTFYHSRRRTLEFVNPSEDTPGPGAYRAPSEFGYYEEVPANLSICGVSTRPYSSTRGSAQTRPSTAFGSNGSGRDQMNSITKELKSSSSKERYTRPMIRRGSAGCTPSDNAAKKSLNKTFFLAGQLGKEDDMASSSLHMRPKTPTEMKQ